MLNYIEKYSKCKIESEYLEKEEIRNKRDLTISFIVIAVFIIIVVLVIKFDFMGLANLR